jgi:hypothetical protein
MATQDEIKPHALFRHKGGKLYRIDSWSETYGGGVRWGYLLGPDGRQVKTEDGKDWAPDNTKIYATQWQVNEKHPKGRLYQASRELKIADLTAVPE